MRYVVVDRYKAGEERCERRIIFLFFLNIRPSLAGECLDGLLGSVLLIDSANALVGGVIFER
jgi:hypothetical protein